MERILFRKRSHSVDPHLRSLALKTLPKNMADTKPENANILATRNYTGRNYSSCAGFCKPLDRMAKREWRRSSHRFILSESVVYGGQEMPPFYNVEGFCFHGDTMFVSDPAEQSLAAISLTTGRANTWIAG